MTKLEKLYELANGVKEFDLKSKEAILQEINELEEDIIKKEILPVVKEKIEPTLNQIQRNLTLVVDYVPDVAVRVRLSREQGIYNDDDFVELTPDPEVEHSTHNVGASSSGRAPASGLCVIRKDGTVIQEKYAADTLVAAIKEAGARRVRELNIICCKVPLVSTTKDKKYGHTQVEVEPGLYVIKHSNNLMKKEFLEKISKALNLGWKVEMIGK